MKRFLFLILSGIAAALLAPAIAADAMPQNDLREFRIGQTVASLPKSGYLEFACAESADTTLSGWSEYARCPRNSVGLHAISFRYDGAANPLAGISDEAQATEVAGQPVLLQLLIDDQARLAGIRIETDPSVRLHSRRGAYLFGEQAKARYGRVGWHCTESLPTPTEQPIGSTFVKEHCEKMANGRLYRVDRDLHHDPSLDLAHFVSASTLLILRDDVGH